MKKFLKNYWFILCMLTGIVAGCLVGAYQGERWRDRLHVLQCHL